jgi:hypothetical protein
MTLKRKMILFLTLILLIVGGVSAAEILQQDECLVAVDEVIEGNLYVLCRDLQIDGTVKGNLIGAAFTATINGTVEKNIYLLGGRAEMRGTLGSDLHFAGVALNVKPESELLNTDLLVVGLSGTVDADTVIPGGIVAVGYQMVINGQVGQNVDFWGSALRIAGDIGGDVDASVGDSQSQDVASQLQTLLLPLQFDVTLVNPGLVMAEDSTISGSLSYQAASSAELNGTITDGVSFVPVITSTSLLDLGEQQDAATAFNQYLSQAFREFTTLGLIGLIGLILIPELIQRPIRTLRRQPITSLGVGLLTFILSFPVVLIALFLSLILILLLALLRLDGVIVAGGIILGIVNIGGTSLFYFVAIFISRMVLAVALGRLLVHQIMRINTPRSWFISLGVGVLLLALVASLPVIGWVFNAFAVFLGLGAILTVTQAEIRAFRDLSFTTAPVYYPDTDVATITMPPPMLEERVKAPGMENLPEGFDFTWLQNKDDSDENE